MSENHMYMKRPITVRLPDYLREMLDQISESEHVPVSELVRQAVHRHVSICRFRQLRGKVLPFAEAQGLLTDEDVYRNLK